MEREHETEQLEGVLLGVCAELACRMDVDPLLVRVNVVLVGLLLAPIVVAAYLLARVLLGRRCVAC